MKKKLLLFVMCLFAFAGNMMAKNDIYYKVDKVDIMQSKATTITFYYDLDADAIIKGFQVEFQLPEGFKILGDPEDPTNPYNPTVGAALLANNPKLNVEFSERYDFGEDQQPVNCFMGVQMATAEFLTGTNLELFTLYIQAAEDVAVGEYSFTTSHCEFANMLDGSSLHLDPKTLTLNVIPYAFRTIADTDTEVPAASEGAEDVLVKRSIKANTWSTLTLPFDLPGDQVKEIFGENVKVSIFKNYTRDAKDVCHLSFETVAYESEGLEKNCPYLIKIEEALSEFKAKDVKIDADEDNAYITIDNGMTGKNKKDIAWMIGTLHANVDVPENDLFLRDNKFYVSTGSTKMDGFRAYFELYDYEYSSGANIIFTIDGEETTGIEGLSINGTEFVNGDVYSVNGTYMGRAEDVMKKLPRGIYIVNNKKVVVK